MTGTRPRWTWPLVALGLFGAVTALRVATGPDAAEGVMLLYTLPIALLALDRGLRGGAAGVCVGLGLLAAWALSGNVGLDTLGYLTRAWAFVLVGGLTGFLADERSRAVADRRWFEMSNDMLCEANLDGYFTRLNERWERCLGWTRQELMARPFMAFVHPDDLAATAVMAGTLSAGPEEVKNFENRYLAKDGSWRWLLWSSRSDEHRKYAVARDVTDRKRLEQERQELLERVEAMARTDSLTGLPNRRSWEEAVQLALAGARRHGHSLALAMVDLDHFKRFNDAHGHPGGDALLTEAAVNWRLTLRATDFLARYGGEEFALLLPDCAPGKAVDVLDRLRAATPQHQTCSVGIAYWDGTESAEELVARADAALYEAKRVGRDRVVASG